MVNSAVGDEDKKCSKNAKYEKIAIDIAYNIINEEWKIGELLQGRSLLAGKYNVSPETIRRALKLLEELNVVNVIERKGFLIKSKESASSFINEFRSKDRILSLREDISNLLQEKISIDQEIMKNLDDIIEQAMLLKNVGIIYPLEVEVGETSHLIGKSIGGVMFWENTGATIIGINRDGHLTLSPGPKLIFREGDLILYVANDENNSTIIEEFVKKRK